MLARYYGNNQARFLSVDPAEESANPAFPQTWNRYSYARNNPIGRLDPDGRKDIRSVQEKKLLDDPDVRRDAQRAWKESKTDQPSDKRQEVGFGVTEPYLVTGCDYCGGV